MKTSGSRLCAFFVGCLVIAACRSGPLTPSASAVAPESHMIPASAWKVTQIASGFSGPVAVDAARNVYVAVGEGVGSSFANKIKKISPNRVITDVGHGFSNPEGVAVHNGYVYVADTGHNAIKRVAKDGKISTVAKLENPGSIAVGKGGSIYVDQIYDCRCIKKIRPNGKITVLFRPYSTVGGITLDAASNLYVAAYAFGPYGCCANGVIDRVTPHSKSIAHSFKMMASESVAVDTNANIYAGTVRSGFRNAALYKIASNGDVAKIASFAGTDQIFAGLAFRDGVIYAGVIEANDYAQSAVYKVSP